MPQWQKKKKNQEVKKKSYIITRGGGLTVLFYFILFFFFFMFLFDRSRFPPHSSRSSTHAILHVIPNLLHRRAHLVPIIRNLGTAAYRSLFLHRSSHRRSPFLYETYRVSDTKFLVRVGPGETFAKRFLDVFWRHLSERISIPTAENTCSECGCTLKIPKLRSFSTVRELWKEKVSDKNKPRKTNIIFFFIHKKNIYQSTHDMQIL